MVIGNRLVETTQLLQDGAPLGESFGMAHRIQRIQSRTDLSECSASPPLTIQRKGQSHPSLGHEPRRTRAPSKGNGLAQMSGGCPKVLHVNGGQPEGPFGGAGRVKLAALARHQTYLPSQRDGLNGVDVDQAQRIPSLL